MDAENKSSSARPWWLLIGAAVVFLVGFSLLESLVGTKPTPSGDGSATEQDAEATAPPAPPQVHRLDDGGVEIRHDFFRRTTIRLGSEDDEKALFDCVAEGIEQTFGSGTRGWDHASMRRETERIQDECMDLQDVPAPPRPRRTGA